MPTTVEPATEATQVSAQIHHLATSRGATLSDILTSRAADQGDELAVRFVDYAVERRGVHHDLTFAELDARATDVAAALQPLARPGDRVAILAAQSHDYVVAFLGALRAGVIAVPLFSPDLPGHDDRLVAALADCEPTVLLGTSANLELVAAQARPGVAVLAVDTVAPAPATYRPPLVEADEVAYLQYTSGSTRLPAGVRITHRNVVVNAAQGITAGGGRPGDRVVSWLPLFHDMGLMFVVGGSLVAGLSAVLMDPVAFLMKPARWLQLLGDGPRVFGAAPNFAFDFCSSRVRPADLEGVDLSGVVAILNGAEPIKPHTLETFARTFAPWGLGPRVVAPSYGLAEATVYVSGFSAQSGPPTVTFDLAALSLGRAETVHTTSSVAAETRSLVELVSCGAAIGQHVAVADPATGTRQPEGSVGEIWVCGPNVGDGYWHKPELSAAVFGQTLLEAGDLPQAPWLRTGDLGFFHDSRLYVTGRIKDVLIIDGRNHYPHDVEHTGEQAHEVIGRHRSAAFSVSTQDGEHAVLVLEVSRHHIDRALDHDQVTKAVRTAVSRAHGVALRDVVLIPPDTIARTTSGKIARAATREAYEAGRLPRLDGAAG